MEVEFLKTDEGVINANILDKKLKNKDYAAFIYSNPAGYYAEQPIKKIHEICEKNDCLVILDVKKSLGSLF